MSEKLAPVGSCQVCGNVRRFAVWHESLRAGVCARCRDARHVVGGGAVANTPRTHEEFLAAADRVMQHYLGEDAPAYGDARFLLDYALQTEDEVRALQSASAPPKVVKQALRFLAESRLPEVCDRFDCRFLYEAEAIRDEARAALLIYHGEAVPKAL